jgi:hypothetical protein
MLVERRLCRPRRLAAMLEELSVQRLPLRELLSLQPLLCVLLLLRKLPLLHRDPVMVTMIR